MNRKQRKLENLKLKTQNKSLRSENSELTVSNINLQREKYALETKENSYLNAIDWLKKRLDNGESYVVERVAVDIDMNQLLYDMRCGNPPEEYIKRYVNERCLDAMFMEIRKRPDLMQSKDFAGHRTFYMEVLKLDKNPHVPHTITDPNVYKHLQLNEEYINPYSEE